MRRVNTHNIDLHLLRIFVAVYELRSVSLAAVNLGMSQPGLSIALSRLRTIVKDPLFLKSAKGVDPTERAREMYEPVRTIIRCVETDVLGAGKFEPETANRVFRVALSDVGEAIYMPLMVNALQSAAPNVSLQTVSLPPAQLQIAMSEGKVDLAAGYFPDIKTNGFLHRRIGLHSFVCIMRAGHPFSRGLLTRERYLEARHVVVTASGRSQEVFETFLEKQKLQRPVGLVTPHFMSLPLIVAQTDLVATVPQALADFFAERPDVVQVRLPFAPPTFQSNLYWSKAMNLDPGHAWFRQQLLDAFSVIAGRRYERNGAAQRRANIK